MNGDKSTIAFCGKICTPFIKKKSCDFEELFPLTCPRLQSCCADLRLPEDCLSIQITALSAPSVQFSGGAACYFWVTLGCCSLCKSCKSLVLKTTMLEGL